MNDNDIHSELDESFKAIRLPVIESAVINVQGYKNLSEVCDSELLAHQDNNYFELAKGLIED